MRISPAAVTRTLAIVAIALATSATVAHASFRVIGEPIEFDAANTPDEHALAPVGGIPHIAWIEGNASFTSRQVYVRAFDGAAWNLLGGSVNVDPTHRAFFVDVAGISPGIVFEGSPVAGPAWVAFGEQDGAGVTQIRVRHFDDGAWVSAGGPLNMSAAQHGRRPSLAGIRASMFLTGDTPYVAWSEYDGSTYKLWVKRFDGTNWLQVGPGALNTGPSPASVYEGGSIAAFGNPGRPYVAFSENEGNTGDSAVHVWVRRFDGTNWPLVGTGPLNFDPDKRAFAPSIANVAGVPYVAFMEPRVEPGGEVNEIRVKRFDGTNWVSVGGPLNPDLTHDAQRPQIVNVGGQPYVAFEDVRLEGGVTWKSVVMRFDGTSWVPVGGPLNIDPTKVASDPVLASTSLGATAAWLEDGQLHAARAFAPACSPATVAVSHDTSARVPLTCDEGTRTIVAGPAHGSLSAIDQAAGTVTYTPAPGYAGPDSFSFKSSDGTLDSSAATIDLTVAAAPVPAGPRASGPVATIAKLSRLKASRRVFAVGPRSTPLTGRTAARKKRPVGTTFTFALDQPAAVSVAIRRASAGRRVGRSCRAPSRSLRRRKPCTRLKTVATLKRTGHAGANKVAFSGRIRGRALARGRYSAAFTATSAAGATAPTALTFSIVAR